jgi:hypothetical protein
VAPHRHVGWYAPRIRPRFDGADLDHAITFRLAVSRPCVANGNSQMPSPVLRRVAWRQVGGETGTLASRQRPAAGQRIGEAESALKVAGVGAPPLPIFLARRYMHGD